MTEKDLVMPLSRIPPLGKFFEALKIKPTGFAAQLFGDVYDQLFAYSTDLREQYDRYYCVEYPTLAIYLEIAHEIYLKPPLLEKTHIFKIKSPGGVMDEAYDQNVRDKVIACLLDLENGGED